MTQAHSRIGPSSAHRWMACPGSVNLIKALEARGVVTDDDASGAALEGTIAHDILATCLIEDRDAWEMGEDERVDAKMLEHVQTTLDTLRPLSGRAFIETDVSLASYHPDAFGRLDFGFLHGEHLGIVDFKYGTWPVNPVGNPQLACYGLGLLEQITAKVEIVHFGIIQPRRQGPGIVWGDAATYEELLVWGLDTLAPAMAATDEFDAALTPGKHCRFCPAKNDCPAYAAVDIKKRAAYNRVERTPVDAATIFADFINPPQE